MPVWLGVLGVPTDIPNLTGLGFVGHALWGLALGVTYWGLGAYGATRQTEPTRDVGLLIDHY